jgi:hypothetical protein
VYENIECSYRKSFELMEPICDQLTVMGVFGCISGISCGRVDVGCDLCGMYAS